MKKLLLCFILLSSPCSYAQTKKILSDQDKLNDCIAAHTTYFTFNDDRPTGKGWQILEGLFAQNQFVAWGEYHNSPKLSKLTAYAMVSAAKQGYKTLCVETSPFVATELMRISRTRNPSDTLEKIYKEGYPGIGTLPFFHTKEDAQMLVTAKNAGYTIWGIDQEFQMCFSYGISKVYHAQSEKVKAKFRTVYDSLLSRWWYPDTKLLDSLQRAVSQKNLRAVLDDIKISKEIYRYGDNEGRASLMKKNFFNYFDQSQQDKVFF